MRKRFCTGSIIEQVASGVIVIGMLLPFVSAESWFGRISYSFVQMASAAADEYPLAIISTIVFICACTLNIAIKFFKRWRWLSVAIALLITLGAIRMVTFTAGQDQVETFFQLLSIGAYAMFSGAVMLVVGACLPNWYTDDDEQDDSPGALREAAASDTTDDDAKPHRRSKALPYIIGGGAAVAAIILLLLVLKPSKEAEATEPEVSVEVYEDEEEIQEEPEKVVTGYRRAVDFGKFKLAAYFGHKQRFTGVESEDWVELKATGDFDADGSLDALVEVRDYKNDTSELIIVYYDSKNDRFLRTSPIDGGDGRVTVEDRNGRATIVFREGIRSQCYVLEDGQAVKAEDTTKNVGAAARTYTVADLFSADDDEGDTKAVGFDINDDGTEDHLYFSLEDGRLCLFNVFFDGWEHRKSIYGKKISILQTTLNGMHDIRADSHYYRWSEDGEYQEWTWDGDNYDVQAY